MRSQSLRPGAGNLLAVLLRGDDHVHHNRAVAKFFCGQLNVAKARARNCGASVADCRHRGVDLHSAIARIEFDDRLAAVLVDRRTADRSRRFATASAGGGVASVPPRPLAAPSGRTASGENPEPARTTVAFGRHGVQARQSVIPSRLRSIRRRNSSMMRR
jgi:hypothetical protein